MSLNGSNDSMVTLLEDLIRVLSYPRKDHDLAVLHFEDSPPLADIRSHTSDLGTLGRLPLELLTEILRHLDLRSFLQYRRVNSRAWRSVNSIPEYRLTATHAINVLRAICGLGVARHFSILQVFNALVSRGCDLCRDSGAFLLFIPTRTRCCICCAMTEQYLDVLGELDKQEVFRFDPDLEVEVPVLHTFPGVYTTNQKAYAERHYVVSQSAARQVRKRMSPVLFRRRRALATSPWCPTPSVDSAVEERFNMLTLL